jgi:hypothetical protein
VLDLPQPDGKPAPSEVRNLIGIQGNTNDVAQVAAAIELVGAVPVYDATSVAIGLAGYRLTEAPDNTGKRQVTEVWKPIEGIIVLTGRVIEFTVTSPNSDIIDNKIISGTFTLTDTYTNLWLNASEGDSTFRITNNTGSLGNGIFADTLGSNEAPTIIVTGAFELNLGQITTTDPSQ